MKSLLTLFLAASFGFLHAGEIRPKIRPKADNTWVWEDGELSPKNGSVRDTWVFDGETLRPKLSQSPRDQWIWDGEKLHKRFGSEVDIVWKDDELKKENGSLERTFILKDGEWYPRAGNRSENTWIVDEDVPLPIFAAVLFLLNPEAP